MQYFFAEIKDKKIYALHESTSLDLVFRQSDGLLIELNQQEYSILSAAKGNISKGIHMLNKIRERIEEKTEIDDSLR